MMSGDDRCFKASVGDVLSPAFPGETEDDHRSCSSRPVFFLQLGGSRSSADGQPQPQPPGPDSICTAALTKSKQEIDIYEPPAVSLYTFHLSSACVWVVEKR